MLRDEASVTSSMSLGGLEGTFVRYWDENATVAVLEFKVEQPVAAPAATKEKEKKKKAKGVWFETIGAEARLTCCRARRHTAYPGCAICAPCVG